MQIEVVNGRTVAMEIAKNVSRHVEEMDDKDDEGAPNVDWIYYLQACESGACQVVTLRDGENLVGYAILMISNNPRHKHKYEAFCEGLFVEKPYRGKWAVNLLNKVRDYAKELNVELHFLVGDEKVGRLLALNGFKRSKTLWSLKNE
jgi:GNAT superfamily N-acetyltransferase